MFFDGYFRSISSLDVAISALGRVVVAETLPAMGLAELMELNLRKEVMLHEGSIQHCIWLSFTYVSG